MGWVSLISSTMKCVRQGEVLVLLTQKGWLAHIAIVKTIREGRI